MSDAEHQIKEYYTMGTLMSSILDCLESAGKSLTELSPQDLSPIDEFHIRGRESTVELAGLAKFSPGMRVLDIGCGLGGSARYIADVHDCLVTGLDLTHEYIEVAGKLSEMVGLTSKVTFKQGNALNLPFEAESFDVVWTEHAQMNIKDKELFYREIYRVLAPGGRLVFHDVFQGSGGPPHYPVPWAEESCCSILTDPDHTKKIIENSHFEIQKWTDKNDHSLQWFRNAPGRPQGHGKPPLSLRLLLGTTASQKIKNIFRNLQEKRITIIQAAAVKHN